MAPVKGAGSGPVEEHVYEIKGIKVKETELELLMYLSKQNIQFSYPRFVLVTFYHFLALLFSFFVSNIVIFVMEGFSLKLLFNM